MGNVLCGQRYSDSSRCSGSHFIPHNISHSCTMNEGGQWPFELFKTLLSYKTYQNACCHIKHIKMPIWYITFTSASISLIQFSKLKVVSFIYQFSNIETVLMYNLNQPAFKIFYWTEEPEPCEWSELKTHMTQASKPIDHVIMTYLLLAVIHTRLIQHSFQ